MRRKYRTGTRWCFWRWSDTDSEYLTRLHLTKTPWFAICLHWIHKADPEPWLHDHPVSFLSVVLFGWYGEIRDTGKRYRVNSWWNFIRATDAHTIDYVPPGGALTIAFMGPKVREWGFHAPDGWIYWRDYYAKQWAGAGRG